MKCFKQAQGMQKSILTYNVKSPNVLIHKVFLTVHISPPYFLHLHIFKNMYMFWRNTCPFPCPIFSKSR